MPPQMSTGVMVLTCFSSRPLRSASASRSQMCIRDRVYTRTTDTFDTPLEKAQIANRSGADYFVSIHRNAMPVPGTGSGVTTLAVSYTHLLFLE